VIKNKWSWTRQFPQVFQDALLPGDFGIVLFF
jgi:hypothetical protein